MSIIKKVVSFYLILLFFSTMTLPSRSFSKEIGDSLLDEQINRFKKNQVQDKVEEIEKKMNTLEKEKIEEKQSIKIKAPGLPGDEKKLSRIEKLFKGTIPKINEELTQFGYDFFSTRKKVLPNYTLPVGSNYKIGPGDFIAVYLWGDAIETLKYFNNKDDDLKNMFKLNVNRDGKIFIPGFGLFSVWGSSLDEVEKIIREALGKKYKKFSIKISLYEIRSFPVYVVGEAVSPGIVLVNGVSTVIDAIIKANGINKSGSLRSITIKRLNKGKKEIIEVDLYKFLLHGDVFDISLMEGDVIRIPTIGGTVGVAGNVRKPGIYEILGTETIDDIISFCGGTLPVANVNRVILERYEDNKRRTIINLSLNKPEKQKVKMMDGDIVSIYPIYNFSENVVTLNGSVKNPGKYTYREGLKLSDFIRSYDDIYTDTYLKYGQIIRLKNKGESLIVIPFSVTDVLMKKKDFDIHVLDEIKLFSRWSFPQILISGEMKNPGKFAFVSGMKLSDALGMVKFVSSVKGLKVEVFFPNDEEGAKKDVKVVYLSDLLVSGDKVEDIPLLPNTHILIKPIEKEEVVEMVTVFGEVNKPNTYSLKKNMKISDVITLSGGYTDSAYIPGIILLRKSVKEAQVQRMKMSIINMEEQLVRDYAETSKGGTQEEFLAIEESKKAKQSVLKSMKEKLELTIGRVVVKIDKDFEKFRGSVSDILLEEGDELYVPSTPSYILILGDVFSQVGISYHEGKTLGEYMGELGGYKKSSDKEEMYVIRTDGSVVSRNQVESSWPASMFSNSLEDLVLLPGDAIVVPTEILTPVPWRPIIRDITSILFQGVSTVAMLKTIGF